MWKEKSGCTSPAEALVRINLGKECMQLSVGHEQLLELRVALEGTGPHRSNLYMGGETEHKFTSGRKKLELGFAVECEGRKSCPILQLCRSRDGLQRPLLAHWQGKLPGEGGPAVAFVIFLFCFKFMIGKVICSDSEAKKTCIKKEIVLLATVPLYPVVLCSPTPSLIMQLVLLNCVLLGGEQDKGLLDLLGVPRGTSRAFLGGQGVDGGGPRVCLFLNKAAPELPGWVWPAPFALLPKATLNCGEN